MVSMITFHMVIMGRYLIGTCNICNAMNAKKDLVNLRIAHLRIGHMVGNPEVGNPEPYQSSGLPTSIITLFSVYLLDLGW